jgi:uncharacterized membrane protein
MRRAATASRTNTFLSIPMLFLMVAAAHFLAFGGYDSSSGGKRALWYVIVLVIGIVIEAIALKAPAVGSGLTKHLDDHKMTIITGFILTAILIVVIEVLFG